jgi:hypothetical protein
MSSPRQLIAQADFGGGFTPPTDAFSTGRFNSAEASGQGALNNLELALSNLIGLLTVVAGIAFIVYFFLGAFKWITAGGDSGKVGKARDEMVNGTIGLIVIVAAYGVVGLIGSIVGIRLLNPGEQLMILIENIN